MSIRLMSLLYQCLTFIQRQNLTKSCFLTDGFFEIRKIAVCFLWLSLPGDFRVTDEALLAETTEYDPPSFL